MGGGGHALEQAGVGEQQGAGADGHEGALFAGVFLLERGEGVDEREGLGVVVEEGVDAGAAGDDEYVVVVEFFVCVGVVDVGFDGEAGGGGYGGGGGGEGELEGFGG